MISFKRILVAKDFSVCSKRALEFGTRLAKDAGADLHVIHIQVLHENALQGEMTQNTLENLDQTLADWIGPVPGVCVTRVVQREISAAPAIVRYAKENACDVIVVGTHGRRGFRQAILGSVAEEVVRTASCAVLAVHGGDQESLLTPGLDSEILLPIDFSARAAQTIPIAREIAASMGAGLRVLHVVEESLRPAFYMAGAFALHDMQPDIEERAMAQLRDLYGRSDGPDVPVEFEVILGHAVTEISASAFENEATMIVMSTHGLRGLAHFFLGSVAERVIRLATCPVLTLRVPGSAEQALNERELDHANTEA
ncbi:universal stress protein [Rhodothermus sp. AH-315-K08]|nr:universal stress protein [Rhodothermus sp. AH-315-K08]